MSSAHCKFRKNIFSENKEMVEETMGQLLNSSKMLKQKIDLLKVYA